MLSPRGIPARPGQERFDRGEYSTGQVVTRSTFRQAQGRPEEDRGTTHGKAQSGEGTRTTGLRVRQAHPTSDYPEEDRGVILRRLEG